MGGFIHPSIWSDCRKLRMKLMAAGYRFRRSDVGR